MIFKIIYFFRALVNYYSVSQIIVKYDGQQSDTLKTTDGCKQGGILSRYLFNFYMDELVNRCISLNIGCKIGNQNTSIIAYCDDVFLMATTKIEMNLLLTQVENYAMEWKLKFNVNKCFNLTIQPTRSKSKTRTKLYLNNLPLTQKIASHILDFQSDRFNSLKNTGD